MHLADAVGTPIVAVFGPSDPRRYAPRGVRDTVVRIDLPCSPCNRIRLPPARCVGHTPDCLAGRRGRARASPRSTTTLGASTGSRRDDHARRRLGRRAAACRPARLSRRRPRRTRARRGLRLDQGGCGTCASTACRSARRFTFRGDSLWWFAELYLHKEQAILHVLRTIAAFDALVERERPLAVTLSSSGRHPGRRSRAAAAARKIRYSGPGWPRSSAWALLRMDARARGARGRRAAVATAARPRRRAGARAASRRSSTPRLLARRRMAPTAAPSRTSARCCVAMESRVAAGGVRYVGIGARTNFRARRWWDPLSSRGETAAVPIERYAPAAALAASRAVYRDGTARAGACGTAPSCARMPSFAAATAGRSSASSSPASRSCSFPGRRARWTKRPRR